MEIETKAAGACRRRGYFWTGARFKSVCVANGERLGTVASIVALLLFWHFGGRYIPSYVLPTIPTALATLVKVLSAGETYFAIAQTLVRILGGFTTSAVFGILIGVMMALWPSGQFLLRPLVRLVMGVPALTWVLLGIIWFRSMEVRVWFFMFIIVFPINALNTYDGVRAVPLELYHMMRSLRPSTGSLLRLLIIPAALPFIFSGLRISLSFAGRIAVFGEALAAGSGIGAEMMLADQMFDTGLIIVWTIILILVLSILDGILEIAEKHFFAWRQELRN
jgi:NitT/TauT family transport system permease protein